jgi:hypothetical protein
VTGCVGYLGTFTKSRPGIVQNCTGTANRHSFATIGASLLIFAFSSSVAYGGNEFPFLEDKLPPGSPLEIISGSKVLLPQGVSLRPIYEKGLALTKASEGFVDRLYDDSAHYCTGVWPTDKKIPVRRHRKF